MKIYFAGSIRGGRSDVGLYHRMIEYLKRDHTVLTEHVGDLSLQESSTDTAIYNKGTAWLRESDVVIAECSNPSLGVGYELAYAEKCEKPVHIFYNRYRGSLSAMLTGDSYFQIHPYGGEDEIYPILDEVLK
ncbi:MAG: nucleoside 2-deoxyribosyltransferase [Clostridia bacterium]|nr:nucleoside 2-deoxyribosyltransferase [Clostridia bacterium]